MNLDNINELFSSLKENKVVQSFMKELSNYLENTVTNNSKSINVNSDFNNLSVDDLTLYGEKITVKFKNKMLIQRAEILQKIGENTQEKGEMYYIYDVNSNDSNSYNLCICEKGKSHEVITKSKDELPQGVTLGCVLRKQDTSFILDQETTKSVQNEINNMIKEKIKEQHEFLNEKRVDGHIYEVDEKYNGRIWLYDLNNAQDGNIEGLEEINFPKELYESAKKGDMFIYQNGNYQKHI